MSPTMFQVTIRREPRFRSYMRLLFLLTGFIGGAVISHLIAASWIIECTFVLLVFLTTWVFFESQQPVNAGKINMTEAELRAYLDAGCPLEWPMFEELEGPDLSRKHAGNNRGERVG